MKNILAVIIAVLLISAYTPVEGVQAADGSENGEQGWNEIEQFFIVAYEKSKQNLEETNILPQLESLYETVSEKVKETDIETYLNTAKEKLLSLGENIKQEFQQGMDDLNSESIDEEELADSSLMKVMNDFKEIGLSMKTLL
ncbi:hypothetical protein [Thalassobacillus devorans]|uniref:hypothetical protein n=1 Tax=Thalassobacillus devorans TaxID=279813 RepID=UPI000A1C7ACB|nr:hypothetical protein [Thalassobacillus devorans]